MLLMYTVTVLFNVYSCFLSDAGAFWGTFLAPILIILFFNVVIFIWISAVLIHHARCKASRKKEATKNKNFVQLMISVGGVMFLFGLTWLFAILTFSVTGLRETFQILFTLFNSFQGFFIFLFFCAINKEARESWKELFGSGRQSLLHSPYANSNGYSPKGSHATAFRARRSATDTSSVRHHDHISMVSKLGDSRKESWDSNNSGYKPDTLQDVKIEVTEDPDAILKGITVENDSVQPDDKTDDPIPTKQEPRHDDFVDNFSLTSATTESGIDTGEHDPTSQGGSPSQPGANAELSIAEDQISTIAANNMERKDSARLKVSIKRYPSRIEREYDVEEIKVEFHSESSSESSDEDI